MGIIFSILAAIFNSLIGIFSNKLYMLGMQSAEIAFYRCLIAFLLISCTLLNKDVRQNIFNVTRKQLFQYSILSFVGIFIMYSFEVLSMKYIPISLVSFVLYSSGIFTIILGCIFLKEILDLKKIVSSGLVILGIYLIFLVNSRVTGNIKGLVMALVAGLGYAMFLFLMKKFAIESGLKSLFYLFLFGDIYLIIPVLNITNSSLRIECMPYLFALAILPTIGGFYCTSKALTLIEAGKVQIFEMTEPFFATLLGWLILKEMITISDMFAGVIIMMGLLVLEIGTIKNWITDKLTINTFKKIKSYKK